MRRTLIGLPAIVSFVLAALSGGLLYVVSQKVHHAESELAGIDKRIEGEREAIRVLHAEWDYLNNPERLERLAREYLGMKDPGKDAVLSRASDLPEAIVPVLPSSKPEVAKPELEAQPVSATIPSPSPSPFPSPSLSSSPKTSAPPARKSPRSDDFNALLKNLSAQGGGR